MPQETSGPADQLRAYLSGRDIACPHCQYNLRDLAAPRCPECGHEITLEIGLAQHGQRLLIAGLIGLSAGAGMNALLLIYLAIKIVVRPPSMYPFAEVFLTVNVAGLLVEGGALALWLWNWRRIRRKPLARRILWMALCWLLTLANIIIFSVLIP